MFSKHFPMKPIQFLAVSLVCLLFFGPFRTPLDAADGKGSPLFTARMVERHGLVPAWFNQVQIDPMRHKVLHGVVEGGTLFLVSDDAKLHAINAENGESLWMRPFGEKGMSCLEPAVNSQVVAVLNDLELFIFNRRNGKQVFQARLPSAAAMPCELSESYVYIPLMNGRMIAFPLEDHQPIYNDDDAVVKSPDAADADGTVAAPPAAADQGDDAVLARIVKSFAETKQSVMAKPEIPKPEPDIALRGPLGIPLGCQSFGNILTKPVVSTQLISYAPNGRPQMHQEILTWVTDRGSIFVAGIEGFSQERFDLRYMVDSRAESYFMDKTRIAQREWNTGNEIVVRPTSNQCLPPVYFDSKAKNIEIPSLVVVGSKGGYVFSVRDRLGEVVWQFVANGPIVEQIAVIGTDVYSPTFPTGMHALDLMTGEEKWFAPGIKKFIAASIKRLYVLDANANLIVLNRETGTRTSSFNVRQIDQCLFNLETDRVYFVNDSGLIQCLRERRVCGNPDCRDRVDCPHTEALARPIVHRLTTKQHAAALKGKPTPTLYWMPGADEQADTTDSEAQSDDGTPQKKQSGEDGGLDADETDKPVNAPKPADEKKKADDDPFN